MAKKIQTVTISKELAERISDALGNYADLLQMEIDSSINDAEIIKNHEKSLNKLDKLGEEFLKQTNIE